MGHLRASPTDDTAAHVVSVIAVSTVAIGLGAAIGFNMGFLATLLIDDLSLSRTSVGLLTSVYFGSTGVGSIAGGLATERLGARLAVALDLVLVAAAAGAIVLVPTYATLLLGCVVAGAGYSLANAGTNVAIAAAVPASRRTLAMTVKTAGVPGMGVVGALLAPWAGARFGWPSVMGTIGILALGAAVATLATLPADQLHRRRRHTREPLPQGVIWLPVASFFLLLGSQPLFSWIVPYFKESVGLAVTTAGRMSSVASAGGVVAMLLIARASDRVGSTSRLRTMVGLVLLSAGGVVVTGLATWLGPWAGIVGALAGLGAQLGVIGNLHAAIVDRAPHAVGRTSGVTMTGYYLGALAGPLSFGFLVDVMGTYTMAWLLMAAALAASAAAFGRLDRRMPLPTVDPTPASVRSG